MSGIQSSKTRTEQPFPGCLGRMVNLFDFGTGVAGNRLLMDKPRHDGSPLLRSQSDVARTNYIGDPEEDNLISEFRRSSSKRKSNGTPMKMLIDQEMSKEVESKHNPPGVVAKLMGLDAIPRQQSSSAAQRSHSRDYSRYYSSIPIGCWQQEQRLDMQIQCEIHQCQEQKECKDVYEVRKPSKRSYLRDKSPQKGRQTEYSNEKKMAIVRQKFIEAKRLSTDEKLRQSKQFHDALDVLCSNKDLLVKFLQEPNSMFSQQMYDLHPVRPPPENKRITLLRPSKMVDRDKFSRSVKKNEQHVRKTFSDQAVRWESSKTGFSPPNLQIDDNPTQPTRIVVLKPSPSNGKPHDLKAVLSPSYSPSKVLLGEESCGEPEDDEARDSREMAEEITRQMCENLGLHSRNETFVSSVSSNGYIGDESSFHKSENDYAMGNCSDSELITPTSRHSWDYINRCGSPYSSSSRASYSPESSVCREAKKRLSERWTMMSFNGLCPEQKHSRSSSSTLGEMLALSDTKKPLISEEEGLNKDQEPSGSTSCLVSDLNKYDNSPRNLLRSKSVPVSSSLFGSINGLDPVVGKNDNPKEVAKSKSVKSLFKEKVSSLLFPKNRKSNEEKSSVSQSMDTSQRSSASVQSAGKFIDFPSIYFNDSAIKECSLPKLQGSSCKSLSPDFTDQGIISCEAELSVTKPMLTGNPSESQDQPSPISVLEPLFEDDNLAADSFSVKPDNHGAKLSAETIKSNLIDKSPPIESIARTLSWDDSHPLYWQKHPSVSQDTELHQEEDWTFFLQSLMSALGLDGELQCDSFLPRWHSPESPLDPFLRDKYIDLNHKERTFPEAKRRQRRSTRTLVFDCVNAALVDITGFGKPLKILSEGGLSPILADELWTRMRKWFSCEVRCVSRGDDGRNSNSLVAERAVKKEVVENSWAKDMRLERENAQKEIEGKLLDELVHEAVVGLTSKV